MKDLVEFPLKNMNIFGYLVPNPKVKNIVILLIFELALAISIIVSLIFGMLTCCIYYKSEFLNLIEKRKRFWNTNNCSTATKKYISWILNTVGFLQKVFVYQAISFLFAFLIPFSILIERFPLGTLYISNAPLLYFFAWTCNTLAAVVAASSLINLDCLFMGLCYEVKAQFIILYDHLERLNVEDIKSEEDLEEFVEKFNHYMEHHKFLLRYIKGIKDCFSVIFLIHFIATVPSSCTTMYVAFESPVFVVKLANAVMCLELLCQFAFYCIPTTFMVEEAPKIADAFYSSNWYGKHFSKLKKATQLKIQESQQEIRMTTLGGMIDMNSKTLRTVVRTSFSICTVLQNLKKQKYL